jgi:hypothetical protein
MDLKEEFANHLLSAHGFHLNPKTWEDAWAEPPGKWEEQIERARKWLILMDKTKKLNRRIGSSYGLKHRVERWHRRNDPGCDAYVANGCFLMAAIRLGFIFSPIPQVYCWKTSKGSYEQFNAFLNISSKSVNAADNFKC